VQILNSHAVVADEDALVAGEDAIVAEQDAVVAGEYAVVAWGMITEQCTQQCRCLCIDSQKSTAWSIYKVYRVTGTLLRIFRCYTEICNQSHYPIDDTLPLFC